MPLAVGLYGLFYLAYLVVLTFSNLFGSAR